LNQSGKFWCFSLFFSRLLSKSNFFGFFTPSNGISTFWIIPSAGKPHFCQIISHEFTTISELQNDHQSHFSGSGFERTQRKSIPEGGNGERPTDELPTEGEKDSDEKEDPVGRRKCRTDRIECHERKPMDQFGGKTQ
jgi:hypothetical protein